MIHSAILATYVLMCSWYGPGFLGARTASGEVFSAVKHTCASKWLRFGTILRLERGWRHSWCRVNDRGPFVYGRDLDVSPVVARELNFVGVVPIRVSILR